MNFKNVTALLCKLKTNNVLTCTIHYNVETLEGKIPTIEAVNPVSRVFVLSESLSSPFIKNDGFIEITFPKKSATCSKDKANLLYYDITCK